MVNSAYIEINPLIVADGYQLKRNQEKNEVIFTVLFIVLSF
jgi:hypothetical protein